MIEKFANSFAVGIIDKDKKEVNYLKEFIEVIKSDSLRLHKHPIKHHYIIQIYLAVEVFILSEAEKTGLNVTDYDLPNEFNAFRKATKTVLSKKDQRFKHLFKAMIQKDSTEIKRLASWIKYLKETTYEADVEIFKKM